jgi:hypothetical protein
VVELKGLDKTFFDELRSLPQHYNLCYVIASRRKLMDLLLPQGDHTSPFFNFMKEHFLGVWTEDTAQSLMFNPRGTPLDVFINDDFAFMERLTALHPLLLQIGCYHLFNARTTGMVTGEIYSRVLDNYMQEAEAIYRYYWDYEIGHLEGRWLRECWQALSGGDTSVLQELERDSTRRNNRTIRLRLAKLGLVLNESGTIELPTGVQSFLARL